MAHHTSSAAASFEFQYFTRQVQSVEWLPEVGVTYPLLSSTGFTVGPSA